MQSIGVPEYSLTGHLVSYLLIMGTMLVHGARQPSLYTKSGLQGAVMSQNVSFHDLSAWWTAMGYYYLWFHHRCRP
ncbi:hypothetical protein F4678DRAFT_398923 [Xylaria arbuscula]|nr:hypothetical protein F4678DRAFT_398923 [Xylaria arbuscula]